MQTRNAPQAEDARVLLIEEHASNTMIVRRLMERFGIGNVHTASSGTIGLNMLGQSKPDLILMDCTMPGLDGYDATRLIRMKEMEAGNDAVPIIGMTANTTDRAKDNCMLAGMNDCAHKPIDPAEMHRLLSQYIHMRGYSLPELEQHEIADDNSVMDLSVLTQFARAGHEPLQMLAMAFVEESSGLLKILQQAFDEKDALKWAQTIHTLRGTSANIGARELESLANHRQERMPPEGAGTAIISQLQATYDKTCAILQDFLKDYPLDERLFI